MDGVKWGALGAAVVALVGGLALGGARADEPAAAADGPAIPLHARKFQFVLEAKWPALPESAKHVDLWIPAVASDERQQAGNALGDLDPATGNRYVHLDFDAPFGERGKGGSYTLTSDVARREWVRKDFRGRGAEPLSAKEKADLARFLAPDRLVPIDGKIAGIAKGLARDEKNVVNLARRYYDHVLSTMKYDKPAGKPWGRGDVLWACDSRYGNCSDFHSLFIALCRAEGIPAKFEIGFPLPDERGAGEIKGYHCWAEFYVSGYGWVPVDISEARKHPEMAEYYFGALTENRVQMSVGRDLALVPPQKGEPVNFIVYPYAEVDGEPWSGVTWRAAYKDLE